MKLKIVRKENKCYVELPSDFLEENEVELFKLRDGYYLLSLPLNNIHTAEKSEKNKSEIDEEEKRLLEKLLSVKFEERTPKQLERVLSIDEKKTLEKLIKKDFVNIFRSKKYPGGVYNISDSIYASLRTSAKPESDKQSDRQQATGDDVESLYSQLRRNGFVVLQGNVKAFDALKKDVQSGAIFGVKAFDGKTYIVTREYFSRLANIIRAVLRKESELKEIAKLCKTSEEGCRAVLAIMAESGEVLERKKNVFVLV
jgi:hypothetical protein